jgi:hypothetical protein
MERSNIVVAQFMVLHAVHKIRAFGDKCPVFYLDEIWINQKHTLKYI